MEKPCYTHCEKCTKEFKYEFDGWLNQEPIPIVICSSVELNLNNEMIFDFYTTHCWCNGHSSECNNLEKEKTGIFLFLAQVDDAGKNITIVLYPYFNITYCSTSGQSCITENAIDTLFVAFDYSTKVWINSDVYGTEFDNCDESICDEDKSICRKAIRDMKSIDIKKVYIDFDEQTVSYK